MITDLIMSVLMIVLLGSLMFFTAGYFDLPVVGINEQGECAWVEEKGSRGPCPTVLPTKFVEIKVGTP